MPEKDLTKWCTPAKLYFGIAIVASVLALVNGVEILAVALKLVFAFIWTYFLAWLCDNGWKTVSWVLVLFPYVMILLGVLMITNKEGDKSKK